MKKLLIIVVCLLLISGCYDYRELNDMSVVDGIYIDYEDNKYNVRLEIVKSNKGKDGNEIKNEILSGKDKNISKAFTKAIGKSVKEVYLGHVSLLVVSNNLAKFTSGPAKELEALSAIIFCFLIKASLNASNLVLLRI